jgi:hypothetical protein
VNKTREGVVFVYFNHASKNFERVKISPAHAHMVIPTEKKTSYSTSKAKSHSTSEIGSAAYTRDACANRSITTTNAWDAHSDSPALTVNDNADCLNPSSYGGSYKIFTSTPDQPRSSKATSVSTSGFYTIATNTSKSIGYFKPVEYAATSPIG